MVSSIVFLTEVPHHACALNIPIPASRGHYTVFGSSPGHLGKPTKAPLEDRLLFARPSDILKLATAPVLPDRGGGGLGEVNCIYFIIN